MISVPDAALLPSASRPMRSSEPRSSPSTYSIDRKQHPSASPRSYIRQTLGCDTCRAIRTSFRKRASASWLWATASGRNFSATVGSRLRSSALYTSPIPPLPSRATILYRPPSRYPGANRPCEVPEELCRPEVRRSLDGGGARGVDTATVWVANASLSTATPHAGQKRLFPAISLAQEVHRAIDVVYAAAHLLRFSQSRVPAASSMASSTSRTDAGIPTCSPP